MTNKLVNDPFDIFNQFYMKARAADPKNIETGVDAMTLSTVSTDHKPSSRVVLFRGLIDNGFSFYTNYLSQKGRELESNPNASLLFFWNKIGVQIHIKGSVKKLTSAQSDDYWNTRPRESQISAIVSQQSSPIDSYESLVKARIKFKVEIANKPIPRPVHWGGYSLVPTFFEFWENGENRLHHRRSFTLSSARSWDIEFISP